MLREVLKELGLAMPGFGLPDPARPKLKQMLWYWCTRQTFASQWLAGGSIAKLSRIMGNYSVVVTEKYAHLRPHLFREEEHDVVRVSLTPGNVVQLSGKAHITPTSDETAT